MGGVSLVTPVKRLAKGTNWLVKKIRDGCSGNKLPKCYECDKMLWKGNKCTGKGEPCNAVLCDAHFKKFELCRNCYFNDVLMRPQVPLPGPEETNDTVPSPVGSASASEPASPTGATPDRPELTQSISL